MNLPAATAHSGQTLIYTTASPEKGEQRDVSRSRLGTRRALDALALGKHRVRVARRSTPGAVRCSCSWSLAFAPWWAGPCWLERCGDGFASGPAEAGGRPCSGICQQAWTAWRLGGLPAL